MSNRCEQCDKPAATQAEYDTVPDGDGSHLCWRPWNRRDSCEEPVPNWRARALAAESELHAMRLAYLDETHGDRDPQTVGATHIRELREAFREQSIMVRAQANVVEAAVQCVRYFERVLALPYEPEEAALIAAVDAFRTSKATP